MPTLENHVTDPDREQAYRRGYLHGVWPLFPDWAICCRKRIGRRLTCDANTLSQWGMDRSLSQFLAPEFPKVGLNANPN